MNKMDLAHSELAVPVFCVTLGISLVLLFYVLCNADDCDSKPSHYNDARLPLMSGLQRRLHEMGALMNARLIYHEIGRASCRERV